MTYPNAQSNAAAAIPVWSAPAPAGATNPLTPAPIDAAAAGDNTLVAAVATKSIKVYRLFLVVAAPTVLTFKSGAATALTGAMSFAANGAITLDLASLPWFETAAGEAFVLNSSNAVQISGALYYAAV